MRYIARQPIFDVHKRVASYELLFRQTRENAYSGHDPDMASKGLVDTALLVGLDVLTNGHSVFVNCTREFLIQEYATILPPDMTVLEVLETVTPDDEVIAACRKLQKAGYRIAIDDYAGDPQLEPLLALADIVKLDLQLANMEVCTAVVRRHAKNGVQLLAEKVETNTEFEAAARLGCTLFQGYFFAKPVMLSTRVIEGSRATYFRVIQAVNQPGFTMAEVEQLVKSDPALCYRLLRYLNSAAFGFRNNIDSISHGLLLLGKREIRKWLTVTCATLAASDKPPELITVALIRAKFCELLATGVECCVPASFVLGLFSMMDGIMDTPLPRILKLVSLPQGVADALLGQPSLLHDLYMLVVAYETANWASCATLAAKIGIEQHEIAAAYINAVRWTQTICSSQ